MAVLKKALWEKEFAFFDNQQQPTALLIDVEEIAERALINNEILLIEGCSASLNMLNQYLEQFDQEIEWISELEDFLNEHQISFTNVTDAPEYPEKKNIIAFDCYNKRFFNLNDCDTVKIYEWFDGRNWIKEILDETVTETIVEITDDSICLDEWDGQNWYTGEKFLHQYVHKIISIDGEPIEEPQFLIKYNSQWQGSHLTGKIVDLDSLKSHLKELDRDVEKYLIEVGKLLGE